MVKEDADAISDSWRIRNELQTLCSEALDFLNDECIRVHFDRIPPDVISPEDQEKLKKVLAWYKKRHHVWFSWLDIADSGECLFKKYHPKRVLFR